MPNPNCHAALFVVAERNRVVCTFPALRIDFETARVPENIVQHLEEAITCHAEKCYTAAAMMVRRTLEELCSERGAQGKNLQERIAALQDRVVLPPQLLEGMTSLRLLGNDAAHIKSQVFVQVGEEEVDLAIAITKEILKALYQYDDLVARLTARQQNQSS